jgi:hypothetical protein
LKKNILNKLALMGRSPFQRFCPAGKKLLVQGRAPRAWSEST